jgi:hypothetical protein
MLMGSNGVTLPDQDESSESHLVQLAIRFQGQAASFIDFHCPDKTSSVRMAARNPHLKDEKFETGAENSSIHAGLRPCEELDNLKEFPILTVEDRAKRIPVSAQPVEALATDIVRKIDLQSIFLLVTIALVRLDHS